jgi:general secretion pathway protein D
VASKKLIVPASARVGEPTSGLEGKPVDGPIRPLPRSPRLNSMRLTRILVFFLLIMGMVLPGYADSANDAFKRGERAEDQNKLDEAFTEYKQAYDLKPRNAKYVAAYARLRFYAGSQHVHAGILLRDSGKLEEALAEFEKAVEIDRSNFLAQQEVRRTAVMIHNKEKHEPVGDGAPKSPLADMAEAVEGPVELQPLSDNPINLRLTAEADAVYKMIGKLAGINVLVDPDFRPPRINVELNDVTLHEALDMVALQSKSFWQPESPNTILVASDTPGKRKELQGNVMKTFYLRNISSPSDLSDAATTLKGILDLSRIQPSPTQNALILRGTPDQMVLAEKLLGDIDKPKPEVIIDIAVMQVSRDRIRDLGTNLPTSTSIAVSPSQLSLNAVRNLDASNFLVNIPGASLSWLMSDSATKILQNPEIRALDNEKATLKIGDRVPVATGSFAGTGNGVNPLVNTQFQYLDVGVNIDITPRIHSEHEVTLKMVLEISSVTGSQNIGGISQPVIGQRRIEHETRLQDGEVNLVGGILEESETKSLSGWPGLMKVPILKYLFAQEDTDRRQNEIVFAITPHIVRAQELTDQNLRMVDVGTGNSTEIRYRRPAGADTTSQNRQPRNGRAAPARESSQTQPPAQTRPTPNSTSASTPAPNSGPASPPLGAAAQPRAAADPCPYGQHRVGEEQGVVVCSFD